MLNRFAKVSIVGVALVAAACSSGSSEPNAATSKTEISQVYDKLFDFANKSTTDKVAAVQDGDQLKTALEQGLSSPLASGVSGARIDSVTLVPDSTCAQQNVPSPCAKVNYDILATNGTPVLSGQTGYATYGSGSWLVAKKTICGLLGTLYSVEGKTGTPPGCSGT
jgi:hypothetical protein